MTDLFVKRQWSTSPTAYWTIQYEYQRSGANMQYRFYWKVWLNSSTSWFYDGLQLRLFLNGVQNNITVKGHNGNEYGWSYEGTTGWYTVSNKTSGTVPFYASLYDTNAQTIEDTSSSYSLTVAPAASVLSNISSFDVDNEISIGITKYNASFTDTLVISYGSTAIKTVAGISNGAKVKFTSAELTTIYGLMSTVKSGTFTFVLTTKNGSTTIGTSTKTASGSISNANPTFTAEQVSYADTNSSAVTITGNNQHIVQNKSSLRVTFGAATGNKGARITNYSFTLNGVTKMATASGYVDFGTVDSSQNLTLSVVVTDSRGNTTTVTKAITMLAYQPPFVEAVLERLNNYEDTTYLTANAVFSSVNSKNHITITYKYKQSGGSYGKEVEILNKVKNTITCDKSYSFVFSIKVEDAFNGSIEREFPLPKGKFPLFIDTEKNAVGINEFPAEGEAMRVKGGIANFEDGVKISGKLLFELVYPVGSIYMSANETSPATLFGGTWEQLKDRFLLGAGSTYSNGATGGEATHTTTIDEMPSHRHPTYFNYWASGTDAIPQWRWYFNDSAYAEASTARSNGKFAELMVQEKGGGKPHNNMPPYLVVYMWKRTA